LSKLVTISGASGAIVRLLLDQVLILFLLSPILKYIATCFLSCAVLLDFTIIIINISSVCSSCSVYFLSNFHWSVYEFTGHTGGKTIPCSTKA
jgi:hypothetical protein